MIARRASTGFLLSLVMVCFFCGFRCVAQSSSDFDRGMAEFRAGNYSSAATLLASAEAASPGTTAALLYKAKPLVHLRIAILLTRSICWGSF
jgi:hypothetical protein